MEKKRNQNCLLLTKQEMVLLKRSEEVKNIEMYGNLYSCLEKYINLSTLELKKNPVFDDKARAVLLNPRNKKEMMAHVIQEWISVENCDETEQEVHCELCGSKNKLIFYIHNKFTNDELHVGSECVKKFPGIVGIQNEQKRISTAKKEQDQRRRKIEFEAKERDLLNYLADADNKLKTFPIMIPYKQDKELSELLSMMRTSKKSYITNGGNLNQIFNVYKSLQDEFDELFVKLLNYYESVKNNILCCDRETANWLQKNNKLIYDKVAKNNSILTIDTIENIYQIEFVQKNINRFKFCLNDKSIRIIKAEGSQIQFSIKNQRYIYPVTFSVSIKAFMKNIGGQCLVNPDYKYDRKDLCDFISIDITMTNCNAMNNSVALILSRHGYEFYIEDRTENAYWKRKPVIEKNLNGVIMRLFLG